MLIGQCTKVGPLAQEVVGLSVVVYDRSTYWTRKTGRRQKGWSVHIIYAAIVVWVCPFLIMDFDHTIDFAGSIEL